MEPSRRCILAFFGLFAPILFAPSDARTKLVSYDVSVPKTQNMKRVQILEMAKNLKMLMDVSYDSQAPTSLPPYCVYPPPNPQSPLMPGPISDSPNLSPPPDILSSPPIILPSPPIILPGSPMIGSGPPDSFTPGPFSPPYYEPSPPGSGSLPGTPSISFEPSPPVFEPPVVYPPPTGPPPPFTSGGSGGPGVWCVAKPSVPDPIIQEAMNYACGSGADCDPIQQNGRCFSPNTLLAHASFAFNSYWQRTKVAGGSCSFGGTAILVTVDPSSQGCHFDNV